MKTLKIVIMGVIILLSLNIKAQVSVNVNIGSPPLWGPSGYTEVRYYYIPDIEAYYDIESSMFIYYGDGVWIRRTYLPNRYRNYDLYNGYKVVIKDYRGDAPYIHFHSHKITYKKGYRGSPQKTIGQKPDGKNSSFKKSSSRNFDKREVHSGDKHQGGGKGKKK